MKYTITTIILAIAASAGYSKCIHETYPSGSGTYREAYICKDKDTTSELKINMGYQVEVRTRLFDFHTVTERVHCSTLYSGYRKWVDDSNNNNMSYVEDPYSARECDEGQRKLINDFKAKWKL